DLANNFVGKIDILARAATSATNSSRGPTNLRRRVGQRAHESSVPSFFHGRNPNAARERDDKFVLKFVAQLPQNGQNDRWFYSNENGFRFLRHLCVLCGYTNAVF